MLVITPLVVSTEKRNVYLVSEIDNGNNVAFVSDSTSLHRARGYVGGIVVRETDSRVRKARFSNLVSNLLRPF